MATCPNCDTIIIGQFCSACGQEQKSPDKFIWTLVEELFDNVFRPDSRAARTLVSLLTRPGELTARYFSGQRACHVPPFRLYLVISFLFFVLLPIIAPLTPDVVTTDSDSPAETENTKEELQTGIEQLKLDFLPSKINEATRQVLQQQVKKTLAQLEDDPWEMFNRLMDLMSAVMFFLVPIFALCLKLAYIRQGHYYTKHLLLAVYNHCFLFLALLATNVLELAKATIFGIVVEIIDIAILVWIPLYMYLSLHRVYQQGYLLTAFKFTLLTICYFTLALIGLMTAALVGVMTL